MNSLRTAVTARGRRPYFLVYLGLHALVVVGIVTPWLPDSPGYMHLSLTGGDLRLPTVPLLYKILPTNGLRVAGQTVLAAACWWVLAISAGRLISDRRVRLGAIGALLATGLCVPVVQWNTVILSESTALSLTALLVGMWLRYVADRRWATAFGVLIVTLFWTFTRQPHVLFGAIVAIAACVAAIVGRERRRVAIVLAIALVLISAGGFAELRHNSTLSENTLMYVIQARIVDNPSRDRWFASHGMPNPRFNPKNPMEAQPLNPVFRRWIHTDGMRVYVEFVLTHPDYLLYDELKWLPGASLGPNGTTPSMLSPTVTYGFHRAVLPTPVDWILWDQGQIGTLLMLACAAVGLLAATRKGSRWDNALLVPGLVTVFAIPQAYIVWLSGGEATHEIDRLSMVTGESIRIGLWCFVAFALDRYLALRPQRDPVCDGVGRWQAMPTVARLASAIRVHERA